MYMYIHGIAECWKNMLYNKIAIFTLEPSAWEEWGEWSQCSETCGTCANTRTRKCKPSSHPGENPYCEKSERLDNLRSIDRRISYVSSACGKLK